MRYDLIVADGHVVDPANGIDMLADVGIVDGRVVEVAPGLDAAQARDRVSAHGLLVMPGIVDPHVHLTSNFKAQTGFKMLARAGVTTGIDVYGPPDDVWEGMLEAGSGISVGCCNGVIPGRTVTSPEPTTADLKTLLAESVEAGALGLKVLGGHYPLSPTGTRRVIEVANEHQAHMTFHVGTSETYSDITGLREAIALTEGLAANIAHVNGYLRGKIAPPLEEVQEAIQLLTDAPRLIGDSYLCSWNAVPARCIDGVPESNATSYWLSQYGYSASEDGLELAILDGKAQIATVEAGETVLVSGQAGLDAYRAADVDTTASFEANLASTMFLMATAKRPGGRFVVDALCTDGGGIPRNITVKAASALIRFGGLSVGEFVQKASVTPARLFGLTSKGHLGPGADADLTVVDLERGKARMTIAGGAVVMAGGAVLGRGGTALVREAGAGHLARLGLPTRIVDARESLLYGAPRPDETAPILSHR